MFIDNSSLVLTREELAFFHFHFRKEVLIVSKDVKSHVVTNLLIIQTIACGILRACGSGTFKAMNECSPAFSNVYLNLMVTGLTYCIAGYTLRRKYKENSWPTKRDLWISCLNSSMGAIVQGLVALAFLSGASVGGPEYAGLWISITVVLVFSSLVQKKHHSFIQVSLIVAIAVGASFYITGDKTVSESKTVPSWIIISLASSFLTGLCLATYSWWLDKNPLGVGTAMIISGTWCTIISTTIFGLSFLSSVFFESNWRIPRNPEYWWYSLLTVFFWVTAGYFATKVCSDGLLNGIRQSVTTGSQLIGAIAIGMFFFQDFPTLQQWPGIFITVGSIFLMVYAKK